jgi:hypothetical protein
MTNELSRIKGWGKRFVAPLSVALLAGTTGCTTGLYGLSSSPNTYRGGWDSSYLTGTHYSYYQPQMPVLIVPPAATTEPEAAGTAAAATEATEATAAETSTAKLAAPEAVEGATTGAAAAELAAPAETLEATETAAGLWEVLEEILILAPK